MKLVSNILDFDTATLQNEESADIVSLKNETCWISQFS
jgi:hypothetical protein